jgi:hypothetical protein
MDSQAKPTRKRTRTRKVEQPPTEKVELTVEEPLDIPENKYQRKPKVGANRPKNMVHTVGLGKLKVETVNGYTDV